VLAVQGIDDVVGGHDRRLALLGTRVPSVIWLALFGLSALSMVLVGHHEGITGQPQRTGILLVVLALALVISRQAPLPCKAGGVAYLPSSG
jgi:hypothetical protein